MEFKFQVQTKIQKPVTEVFDAVYNPEKLSQYFTTGGSSGPLDEGKTISWAWHDCAGTCDVHVVKMVPNELIVFDWATTSGGYDTRTEITFEELSPRETLLKIAESGWEETDQGLADSYGNCFGWTEMSCCLKAWIEFGVDLRHGSMEGLFDAAK